MASTQKTYGALATSAEPQALNTGDTKQRQSRALRAHICIMVVALLAVAAFVMACVAVSKGGGGGRATPGMRGPPGPPGLASHPGDQSGYAVTSVALNESAVRYECTLPPAFRPPLPPRLRSQPLVDAAMITRPRQLSQEQTGSPLHSALM